EQELAAARKHGTKNKRVSSSSGSHWASSAQLFVSFCCKAIALCCPSEPRAGEGLNFLGGGGRRKTCPFTGRVLGHTN
ncbi:hypothetical protein Nmel_014852, partial [Mimus melanotis]